MKGCYFWFLFYIVLSSFQLNANIIIKEICPTGFSLEAILNQNQQIQEISFSDGSGISYEYEDGKLSRVVRYDENKRELYYQTISWDGIRLVSQNGWFTTEYIYDDFYDKPIAKINPFYNETIDYDHFGNPLRIGNKCYKYDEMGQIIEEQGSFVAVYDHSFNLIKLNENVITVDGENKIADCNYDENGNLLIDNLTYGNNNLISEANGVKCIYDLSDRLIQKGNTCFLYLGCEEIASIENGQCKTLKIPGIGGPIAIEIEGKPYAPIIDSSGIIRKLLDPLTHSVYRENNCDIFGGGITDSIPYAYRGKRYDPFTGLIYFGKRFYNPSLHRWMSPDPLGSIDHANLYQYVYNNPLKYSDPLGTNFWGYVLGLGEVVAGGAIMLGGLGLEIATAGGFTLGFTVVEGSGLALITDGLARTTRESRDMRSPFLEKGLSDTLRKGATKFPPRFNGENLGTDPSLCPGEGFEWRGKGSPESGKGNWVNPITGERLHPDLWHPDPKGPHWGYIDPNGTPYDLFPDGSWQ